MSNPTLTPWRIHRMSPYKRVSKDTQRDKGNSLEAQEWHLRNYYAEHGLEWPDEAHCYTNVGSAYRDDNILKRPGFQRLLSDIRGGIVSGFYVFR